MAGVLERNVSVELVRDFKRAALARNAEFAALARERLPGLADSAQLLASIVVTNVAGLWPLATPSDTVLAAIRTDPALACATVDFGERLRATFGAVIRGLISEAPAG
jgi:Tetracyclin repressor-like, C-terminal domain